MQFTCWRSAHEIILGGSSYNFGCGYTYGTRFGHNLTGPPGKLNLGVAIKKQNNAKLAILAYLKRAQHDQPER